MTTSNTNTNRDTDHDEAQIVYVNRSRRGKSVYHSDFECSFCNELVQRWERAVADEWGLTECQYCTGEMRGPRQRELPNVSSATTNPDDYRRGDHDD